MEDDPECSGKQCFIYLVLFYATSCAKVNLLCNG